MKARRFGLDSFGRVSSPWNRGATGARGASSSQRVVVVPCGRGCYNQWGGGDSDKTHHHPFPSYVFHICPVGF